MMVDILHRVGATAPIETVWTALTTPEGLAAWWTTDTRVADDGTILFRFSEVGGFDMRAIEERRGERLVWEVVDGPGEWVGTTIAFDLTREDDWTIVRFVHGGWRETSEFMSHCSTKWASFLLSLKDYTETGTGQPHPQDVRISNWH